MHLSLIALFKESPLCFMTIYTRENPCLLLYCVNELPAGPTAPKRFLSAFSLGLFCLYVFIYGHDSCLWAASFKDFALLCMCCRDTLIPTVYSYS